MQTNGSKKAEAVAEAAVASELNGKTLVIMWFDGGYPLLGPPISTSASSWATTLSGFGCQIYLYLNTDAMILTHRHGLGFTFNNCPGHVYMTSISLRVNELKW